MLGTQPFRAAFVDAPLNLLMSGAACAAWWRTGRLLERRERQGALWAIIALAPNVLAALIPEADVALPSFVVGVAGILLIASVWNELR